MTAYEPGALAPYRHPALQGRNHTTRLTTANRESTMTEPAPRRRTLALDFDGVVHAYTSPWTSPLDVHDAPVPGALDFIRDRLFTGWVVILHTARFMHNVPAHLTVVDEISLDDRAAAVLDWFLAHGGDGIVASEDFHLWLHGGKPHADVYLDDRALRFDGVFPSPSELYLACKTWNKA